MIIYSVLPPMFENPESVTESFSETENGVPAFYEKDISGNSFLKFSTDPTMYLERQTPLH